LATPALSVQLAHTNGTHPITPDEIAAASIYWLADEAGPISGSVVELEQHPFIGRNPPKDSETLPGQKA